MLIGLAAKNAILIVEFAKAKHDEGMSPEDAALESARLRFPADSHDRVCLSSWVSCR
jgi:multidrug efflux pump subunit AcrB